MKGSSWHLEQFNYTRPALVEEILSIENPQLHKDTWALIFIRASLDDVLNIQLCCKIWYNATKHRIFQHWFGLQRIKSTQWYQCGTKEFQEDLERYFSVNIRTHDNGHTVAN